MKKEETVALEDAAQALAAQYSHLILKGFLLSEKDNLSLEEQMAIIRAIEIHKQNTRDIINNLSKENEENKSE